MAVQNDTRFQWVKGDNSGTVENVTEEKDGFTYFQSGRRINSELINEFMVPITHDEQIVDIPNHATNVTGPTSSNPGKTPGGYSFQSENDDTIRDAEGNEFRQPKPSVENKAQQVNNTQANTHQENQPKPKQESPIRLLINQSKKDDIEVNYTFNVELPKKDVYNIINNSFDVDLDQEISSLILENIDIKELKTSVEEAIDNTIKSHYKTHNK